MDLYDDLGAGYDVIIEWERRLARETPFYQELFERHDVRRLLDVGCGTGWHARLFASWGIHVVGIDPSAAMLETAREVTAGLPVELRHAGFEDLDGMEADAFEAAVCIGNTLPHAVTVEARLQALRGFLGRLKPGGTCVIQTLNYDGFAAKGERFQPLSHGKVEGREQLLLRMFDFGPETWQFSILRFTRAAGGWQFGHSSTPHLPVFGADLQRQLRDAGFTDVRLLGGFDAAPFDPATSDMLLATGVR